jgi:hypothetical protein
MRSGESDGFLSLFVRNNLNAVSNLLSKFLALRAILVAFIWSAGLLWANTEDPALNEGREIRNGREWINADQKQFPPELARRPVPSSDIYEVVASKMLFAFDELAKTSFVSLTVDQAKFYAGRCYHLEPKKQPYLVRLVYCSEGPWNVFTADGKVFVENITAGSFGTIFRKSALVVNLESPPTAAFVYAAVDAE